MSRIMNRQPHEIVGSSDYAEVQAINKFGPMADPHEYNGNPSTGIEIPDYIPRSFKIVNETNDDKYRTLQSEMMDNGWALEQSDDGKKYSIFGDGGVKKTYMEFSKNFLGSIPINSDVGKFGDQGKPIVESKPEHEISKIYLNFAKQIKSIYLGD